jgi:hypothetical protein
MDYLTTAQRERLARKIRTPQFAAPTMARLPALVQTMTRRFAVSR